MRELMTILALLFAAPGAAEPVQQGFDMVVPHGPQAVAIGGRRLFVYELHLTNFASRPLTIERVEAIDATTGRMIAAMSGTALARAGGGPRSTSPAAINPGQRHIVYWELALPMGAGVPTRLTHRVVVDGEPTSGGSVDTERKPLLRLGAPLRGGPWTAAYDPDLERGHRRVVYAVAGSARIPGRHAIDWFRAGDGDGRGADVLAVAGGIVVGLRDDMDEPQPGAPRPKVALADAAGNNIVLRLSDGSYAHYEHLARGLSVRQGQRVRAGQVIGRIGATGSASRPHLHFHLSSGPGELSEEGLPYRLSGLTRVGRYEDVFEASAGGTFVNEQPDGLGEPGNDMPSPNIVVRFD